MAYEYDRFEREDGGGSFLMGLLAGTVLGAGLGMLFAPKAGSELRNQLTEQAGRLRSTANDTYQQASGKVGQMVDKGREAYDRARQHAFGGKWMLERLVGMAVSWAPFMNRAARGLARRRDLADTFVGVTGDIVPARAVLRPAYALALAYAAFT